MSLYYLNKIKIKTESDALEFIDMVAAKLPEIKKILKKNSLERQSLLNRVGQVPQSNSLRVNAPDASVLDRTQGPVRETGLDQSRIEQLRAAEAAPAAEPGAIGVLDLEDEAIDETISDEELAARKAELSAALAQDSLGQDTPETGLSEADLVPIGSRVAGKASALKAGEKLSQSSKPKQNSLRSLKKN